MTIHAILIMYGVKMSWPEFCKHVLKKNIDHYYEIEKDDTGALKYIKAKDEYEYDGDPNFHDYCNFNMTDSIYATEYPHDLIEKRDPMCFEPYVIMLGVYVSVFVPKFTFKPGSGHDKDTVKEHVEEYTEEYEEHDPISIKGGDIDESLNYTLEKYIEMNTTKKTTRIKPSINKLKKAEKAWTIESKNFNLPSHFTPEIHIITDDCACCS